MSRLHLFIDTNIFLNLYHYSDDDLEELKKIIVLLENNKLVLYTTSQVIDEFNRNRDDKLKEALESIKKITTTTQFPNICKAYDEYQEITKALRDFHRAKERLTTKLLSDIFEKKLKADTIIHSILYRSHCLKSSPTIVGNAKERFDLGNPPGKNGSYGDALNWELLLEGIKSSVLDSIDILYFITQDRDYISSLDPSRFNTFLFDEWLEKKKFPIQFYGKLTDFFREKFPDIRLAKELNKTLLIQDLCNSHNFANSKVVLWKLCLISDFTKDELEKIIQGALSNNQIYWISSQVNDSLNSIINGRRNELDPDLLKEFDSVFNPEYEKIEKISLDDIPF